MIKQAGYLCCFEVLMPYIKPNLLLLEFGKRTKKNRNSQILVGATVTEKSTVLKSPRTIESV
jgi:hypothetical protein